jgi:thioredoxin-like negative regulator of GroEL
MQQNAVPRRAILAFTIPFALSVLLAGAPPIPADEALTPIQQQLRAGDFDGALKLYDDALRVAPKNQELRQRQAILRQVITLRGQLEGEQDAARWEQAAGALRAFYWDEGLLQESLALDTRWYQRDPSAETASRLAETQLELGLNAEARATLAERATEQAPTELRLLHGIAAARQDGAEAARPLLGALSISKDAPPELRFLLARLQALGGKPEAARASLAQALATTAPSQQDRLRDRAKTCSDFAALAGSEAFAQVLETKSRIAESSCSTGKSCGGCPRATACSGASAAKAPIDD